MAHDDHLLQLVDDKLLIYFEGVELSFRESSTTLVKAIRATVSLDTAVALLLLKRELVEVRVLLFGYNPSVLLSSSFHVD